MIIYFSGSGNSLDIAKRLSNGLNDSLLHINNVSDMKELKDKQLGIVFPVYYYDIPTPVKEFLTNCKIDKNTYIYAIATCGGNQGRSLKTVQAILQDKGCDLSYGKVLIMPDSSAVCFGNDANKQLDYLTKVDHDMKQIVNEISDRIVTKDQMKSSLIANVVSIKPVYHAARHFFRKSVKEDVCTGCGICQKVCSSHNIEVIDGTVTIGANCCDCLACVQWCPNAAIRFKRKDVRKEKQYHNPNVSVKEMFRS